MDSPLRRGGTVTLPVFGPPGNGGGGSTGPGVSIPKAGATLSAGDASASDELVRVLREVVGPANAPVALHEPSLDETDRAFVDACLASTFVSTVGRYVEQFERMLADYTGARHAVVVVNGTAALHVALTLAGVGRGDEVLVPALSFVATANAVAHCGAVPHFVDSEAATLGMGPDALDVHLASIAERTTDGLRNRNTGARIAAIVPMHTFGHPVAMGPLMELANRYGLPVVEDAAESLGSTYQGRHTGTFGRMGTLSFNGNKIVTTGGGGAILTDDDELARRARQLTTTAKRPHRWAFVHDDVAWNYRLPNLNAALGCAQMEKLARFVSEKRALAERYRVACAPLAGFRFVVEPEGARSNYWLNTVQLRASDLEARDRVLGAVNDLGYQCRPAWTLLNKLPMYGDCPRAPLPVAEQLEAGLINLPSSAQLGARAERARAGTS